MENYDPAISEKILINTISEDPEKAQQAVTDQPFKSAVTRGLLHQVLNHIDDTQTFLLGGKWAKSGKDFFEALAEYLAKTLGMDFVCIDKLLEENLEAETVAVYYDGKFEDNIRYKLKDTPCGKVVGQTVCCFPEKVRLLFPNDEVLQEMIAESYVGITLWGANGKPIGLIAVIGRKPLVDTLITEMVLKQVAVRAAAELEHRHSEEIIRTNEKRFIRLYENMNEGLVNHEIIYEMGKATDYIITDTNPAFERITGIDRVSAIGQKASTIYGTAAPPYLDIYERVASGGAPEYFETYFPPMGKQFSISVFSPEKGKFATVFTDITERKLKEETLNRLNHMLAALEKSSQAMAYSQDEKTYLEKVCSIVVEDCGFAMVWIGFANNDESKSIIPVASAGFDKGYLETLILTWADKDRGRGPTGTAIRTGEISMCRNMLTDPAFKPWREEAIKRGYASSIALPLVDGGKPFGSLTIYARNPDSFPADEIKLLTELANDLSHGINALRLREAHKRAEEALNKSHEELEKLVEKRTSELIETNELLKIEINIRKTTEGILTVSQEHLRALTHRMDLIAEEERTRIARELHDEMGHQLTAIKYDIDELSGNPDLLSGQVKNQLGSITVMIESLIDTVRKISTELRPGILDHLGLFPAIEWQIKQFQKRTKICCYADIQEYNIDFNKDETTIIFRILQEILTNVARHSKASKVKISVKKKDDFFMLEVSDNGVGFDLKGNNNLNSLGLLGMKERALSIGGDIRIESSPGRGTTIKLLL